MSRILVTGAAGFIGSHTVDALLKAGHEIVAVDNFRTGRDSNLTNACQYPTFKLHRLDVAESGVLLPLVEEFRPHAIIHLSALVSVPESIADPTENERLNYHATRLVAEAACAHGTRRVVFASSAAVYGDSSVLPLAEETPCSPLSPYGWAKLKSEKLLLDLARTTGAIVRCHRYFNVFGPRQDPTSPYSGVISIFHDRLQQGATPTINGDGEQTRDFIYVGDVARANVLAATAPNIASGIANICTGRAVSLNALYAAMSRAAGRDIPPHYGPARLGEIRHSLGSPLRAKRDLDFTAQISLQQGLEMHIAGL